LREFDQEVATRQGQIAVVSFARPEHVKAFADRLGHPFLWLADPKRSSYQRLGPRRRGVGAIAPPRVIWGYVRLIIRGRMWRPEQLDLAQMGGDFVFDHEGNLTLSHVSASSDDRPSVRTVMAAFRRAASATSGAAEA
jgi:alkyl-hydroperoxide reductase/thiol specific antioxidant family protein